MFTREQLFDRIWGDFGDLHTVTVHIGRIREKIEENAAKPRLIATVWGIVGLVVVPFAVTALVYATLLALGPDETRHPPLDFSSPAVRETLRSVESSPGRWSDPEWQQSAGARLANLRLRVKLTDPGGRVVYESARPVARISAWGLFGFTRMTVVYDTGVLRRDVVVYNNAQDSGRAEWFEVRTETPAAAVAFQGFLDWFMPVIIVVIIILTIWGAVAVASRAILRPLASLSSAARAINDGTLEFAVPASAVKEVNEFAQAFGQMSRGLKESMERQAGLEQERRLFRSAVAHDLRTPLSSVRGYLEGLRDGVAKTEEKRRRYVQVALEKAAALEHLIESFFAYTKTEFLDQPLEPEDLELGQVLSDAVEAMRPIALAKQVELVQEPAAEACMVAGDPHMLARVVGNLLDNAVRYTPAGGTVTVGCRCESEQCRFWVRDSGPGIPAADLGRIFQPLYRGDKARGSRTGGTGLGLAVAMRLTKAHGGTISAFNQNGAVLEVTIPSIVSSQKEEARE